MRTMQDMINDGSVWKMEGSMGRAAMRAIEYGECVLGEVGHYDYWGNYVPSRFEVKPGTKGSLEYQQKMIEAGVTLSDYEGDRVHADEI